MTLASLAPCLNSLASSGLRFQTHFPGLESLLACPFRFDTLAACRLSRREKMEVNSLSLILYTKPGCPYCAKAREYYTTQGIPFEDRNAQDNEVYRREMLAFTDGDRTVPTIVEDGKLSQIGWEGRG